MGWPPRKPRFCERCSGLILGKGKRFCGHKCSDEASKGQPVPAERAKKISDSLTKLGDQGLLPIQSKEGRAKQSATKKAQAAQGLLSEGARRGAKAVHENPERSAARATAWKRTLLERYGVQNLYDIPGVRERAGRAKSEAMAKRISEGRGTSSPLRFKSGVHHSPLAGAQHYQSSWEELRMRALDKAGVEWTKYHGIRIQYADKFGVRRYYVPDFLVVDPDFCLVEEVKGQITPEVSLKTAAAEAWCTERGVVYRLLTSRISCENFAPPQKARDLGIRVLSLTEMASFLGSL